jgi:putative salt-induced outer membrane protein YdiY
MQTIRNSRSPLLFALVALSGLLGGLLTPGLASAQNPPPPPPKHEGTAELAFVGTTGNSKEQTLSAGAEYIARPTNWLLKNRFQVVRGDTDSVLTTESWLYGFRTERTLRARLSAFGEYAYFRDQFAGIDSRNGITGGLMFTIIKTEQADAQRRRRPRLPRRKAPDRSERLQRNLFRRRRLQVQVLRHR